VVAPKLGSIREAGPATTLCKIKLNGGISDHPTVLQTNVNPDRWGEPPRLRGEPSPFLGRGGGRISKLVPSNINQNSKGNSMGIALHQLDSV